VKPPRPNFLRLSTRHLALLRSGVAWICTRDSLWSEHGQLPNARPDRTWMRPERRGNFNEHWMAIFHDLQLWIEQLAGGRRVGFTTPFDVAACQLAVRTAVMLHRHSHYTLTDLDVTVSAKRLLRRLEAARKRAKRQFVAESGSAMYAQALRSWQQFIRWMRVHFMDCKCKRRRHQHLGGRRRALVRQFVSWAMDELAARGRRVPSEAVVRRYVRLALRYVRRGRTGHSIRTLSADRPTAVSYFTTFIAKRMGKKKQEKGKK
jgi:hypothetical protein